MARGKKRKSSQGRPITNYYRKCTQEQENEGLDQNKHAANSQASEGNAGNSTRSPFANFDAAPEGVTIERTLDFIRQDSKNQQGPSFLYSQEDVLELHTPVARPAKKLEIDSTEWRGWLRGCGADVPNQAGTPKLDPWEFSPWTPKQMGPKTIKRISSERRRGDESVVRRATGLDARLRELFPSPAVDKTPSRGGSSSEGRARLKRSCNSNDDRPSKHIKLDKMPTVDEVLPKEPVASGRTTPNSTPKPPRVMEVVRTPENDGWSDDEFVSNLPSELLDNRTAVDAAKSCSDTRTSASKRGDSITVGSAGRDSLQCCLTPYGPSGRGLPDPNEPQSLSETTPPKGRDPDVRFLVDSVAEVKGTKRIIACNVHQHFWIAADLEGLWAETEVHEGDSVNLIGKVWKDGDWHRITINDKHGMVITYPDFFLSGSRVSSAVAGRCIRQSILEEWVHQTGRCSESMFIGSLLHELIQGVPGHEDLLRQIEMILARNAEGLLEADITEQRARQKLQARIPGLLDWLEKYVGKTPKPEATLKPHWGTTGKGSIACISDLIDIEDTIERSKYGLKGRVDATVKVNLSQPAGALLQLHPKMSNTGSEASSKEVLSPLEFKTGRKHVSHQAQVSLYLMMLEERYGVEHIGPGLLWYLSDPASEQDSQMIQVDNVFAETAQLVRGRNALVSYLAQEPIKLPSMLEDERTCSACSMNVPCAILHKAREGGSASSSGYGWLFNEITDGLTPRYSTFLNRWIRFTELEDAQGRASSDDRYVPTVQRQLRGNLLDFISMKEHASLRKLVIDLEDPRVHLNDQQEDIAKFVKKCKHLNQDQLAAVEQILTPQDYCLIWGMPGTGKTTMLAAAIQGLVQLGKSILVSSYTNSAVDNLLLKLEELGVKFIRVGSRKKINEKISKYTLGGKAYPNTSLEAMKKARDSIPVVATTCLGSSNVFVVSRRFDVCVIDEAAQISIPAVLGPIMRCNRFVLVGDPQQLRPLITAKQAAEEGMGETLLEKLANQHSNMVAPLRIQYRMANDIMSLANHLVYGDKLECGSTSIANRRLQYHAEASMQKNPKWIQQALDPEGYVRFLNTDPLPAYDTGLGTTAQNAVEGRIVLKLVDSLIQLGLSPEDIGVIAPYRAQISMLETLFSSHKNVEVSTVDTFQGRDKNCIIVSFTKSNSERRAGKLLEDYRRINVILTRAKSKLIALGSATTLSSVPFLKSLVDFVRHKNWLVDLPKSLAVSLESKPKS